MNTRHLLLTLLAVFGAYAVVVACDPDKQLRKSLAGKWDLVRTDCCGRTTKTSIAKPGDKSMHFRRDGSLTIDVDGKTYNTYYNFLRTDGSMEKFTTLQMGRENYPAIFNIEKDTLIISWGYMDLQTEYYVKKRKY